MTLSRSLAALAAALVLAGCGGKPDAPAKVKTGAEDAARQFFTALADKDWAAAYQRLDAPSKAACGSDHFARRAEAWSRNVGFEPSEVVVQSCDERGDEAVAHVNLKGVSGSSLKYYKDAISLRREAGGWGVSLPESFGKAHAPKG